MVGDEKVAAKQVTEMKQNTDSDICPTVVGSTGLVSRRGGGNAQKHTNLQDGGKVGMTNLQDGGKVGMAPTAPNEPQTLGDLAPPPDSQANTLPVGESEMRPRNLVDVDGAEYLASDCGLFDALQLHWTCSGFILIALGVVPIAVTLWISMHAAVQDVELGSDAPIDAPVATLL